jgi:hypothetical protein
MLYVRNLVRLPRTGLYIQAKEDGVMKKVALIIVLTVSLGLVAGIMVDQASAFGFFGGKTYGSGYGCGYGAPYYYGIMPYWGYGYGYGYPGYYGGAYWGGKRYGKRAGAPKGPGAPMKK